MADGSHDRMPRALAASPATSHSSGTRYCERLWVQRPLNGISVEEAEVLAPAPHRHILQSLGVHELAHRAHVEPLGDCQLVLVNWALLEALLEGSLCTEHRAYAVTAPTTAWCMALPAKLRQSVSPSCEPIRCAQWHLTPETSGNVEMPWNTSCSCTVAVRSRLSHQIAELCSRAGA